MNCPQCATGLGEGAKACATCGWSQSRRTLWIVLGCVLGFLLLACCGAGTYLLILGKKFAEGAQEEFVPVQVILLRTQVVNYAKVKGEAPKTLGEAAAVPLVSGTGEKVEIRIESGNQAVDRWQRPFRFTMNPDRTFEVRSSGPDGQFDNADDVFEKGSLDDDLQAVAAMVGELLELPSATVITEFSVESGRVTAQREIEGGLEVIELKLPCVLSITKGAYEPRYASLKGIMAAKKKPLEERPLAPTPSKTEVKSLSLPPPRGTCKRFPPTAEGVRALLAALRAEKGVL